MIEADGEGGMGRKMRQSGGISNRIGAERRRKIGQGEREERRSRVVRRAEWSSKTCREESERHGTKQRWDEAYKI